MPSPLATVYSLIDQMKRNLSPRGMKSTLDQTAFDLQQTQKQMEAGQGSGPEAAAANKAVTEKLLNAVLSFAPAGIIAPATKDIASTLGIESVTDRALNMFKEGKSYWKIGTESEKALREMRNPGGALTVFIGPDGIPRIKIDPAVARIAKSAPVRAVRDEFGTGAKLTSSAQSKGLELGPEIQLSDILLHPSLYDISPAARTATVQHNPIYDIMGGGAGYSPATNSIQMSAAQWNPKRLENDPMGYLLETLLHEPTHIVQIENKVRTGGSDAPESIRQMLDAALTQGSYRTPDQIQQLQKYLTQVDAMPESELKAARLKNLYESSYGEWEARQASQYGLSLPLANERGATY